MEESQLRRLCRLENNRSKCLSHTLVLRAHNTNGKTLPKTRQKEVVFIIVVFEILGKFLKRF